MTDFDAVVVGGGLFGRTIALALFVAGRDVLVVDDKRPESGSKPSGCLMKPSWFSSLGKDVYDPSLELLGSLFGIEELSFILWPTKKQVAVMRVPTSKILCCHGYPEMYGTVTRVGQEFVEVVRPGDDSVTVVTSRLIIVAAGVWCSDLMKVDGLVGKKGVAFTWHGVCSNVIRPWAPYKQIVIFQNTAETVWGGDGAAIKPANWTEKRQNDAEQRVTKAAQMLSHMRRPYATTGIRPNIPGVKPCLLEERAPGLWLATGGAKNGTIAAGWAAHEILRRTS